MAKKKGFILTTQWEDVEEKHLIRFLGVGEDGPFKIDIDNFSPLLFIEKKTKIPFKTPAFTRKDVPLKSFSGQEVEALYFKTQKDLYLTKDLLSSNGIRTFEADLRSPERYLMEHFLNGEIEVEGDSSRESGLEIFKNPIIRPSNFRPQFKVMSLDIETGMDGRLFSIALVQRTKGEEKKIVLMVGPSGEIPEKSLYFYLTEKELLLSFLNYFHSWDPDILIGWHVIGFDLQFLENKFNEHQISFNLGRLKSKAQIFEKKNAGWIAQINGRIVLDGPALLKSNFFKFENYKLETVAQNILGIGKEINSQKLNKVEEIERRFREDKEALAKYNLLDCILVLDIFDKLSLIELIYQRATISGLQMDKVGISTMAFDHVILPRIHRKGFVASNVFDIQRDDSSTGGHVVQPKPGIYDYVVVLDFKSLYPTIISTFKIDPLSRIRSEVDSVDTPVGIKFSKKEHILPAIIDDLMEKRKDAKARGNESLSQAIKILMNSFYGVMGSSGSRFYHADLPSAITGTGQWIIKESIKFLQSKGFDVLYGDTDSIFVKLKESDKRKVKEVGGELASEVNNYLAAKIYREFKITSKLEIQFEKIYKKLFLPLSRDGISGAKKRYAGLLLKAGKEELNFVGLEYIRSDWTNLAKKFQYELFSRTFRDEDVDDWIKSFVERVRNKEFDSDLVYRKRLSKNPKEYTKNIPPHVKAALLLDYSENNQPKEISYVMTPRGPIPIQKEHSDIDYNHYIDKQIKPLADGILSLRGKSFEDLIVGDQLSLF